MPRSRVAAPASDWRPIRRHGIETGANRHIVCSDRSTRNERGEVPVIHDHRRLVAVLPADVHGAVTGRLGTTSADLGRLALRNVERPVQAFSLTPCGDHDPGYEG
jgi:hypothetical protein